MLKIKKIKFREKFTEINIRQRMYKSKSFITLMITTEFFPSLVGEALVSGVIETKLDIEGIKSLDDLVGKSYKGNIGSVTISVNNDGIWEHETVTDFEFSIDKRVGRDLSFVLKTENCEFKTKGVMVSLYTTTSTEKEVANNFDLTDFYERPIVKEVGNSQIRKYFVKE